MQAVKLASLTTLDKQTVLFSPPRQLEPLPTTAKTQGSLPIACIHGRSHKPLYSLPPPLQPFLACSSNLILYGFWVGSASQTLRPILSFSLSQFFTFLNLYFLSPSFLSLDWVFVFLKGSPCQKLMSERNNEGRLVWEKTQEAKMYGLQLACTLLKSVSQPEESVVCGCGPPRFLPGNRVIYLTRTEPAELNTYQSIPICQNNNTDTLIF